MNSIMSAFRSPVFTLDMCLEQSPGLVCPFDASRDSTNLPTMTSPASP